MLGSNNWESHWSEIQQMSEMSPEGICRIIGLPKYSLYKLPVTSFLLTIPLLSFIYLPLALEDH